MTCWSGVGAEPTASSPRPCRKRPVEGCAAAVAPGDTARGEVGIGRMEKCDARERWACGVGARKRARRPVRTRDRSLCDQESLDAANG